MSGVGRGETTPMREEGSPPKKKKKCTYTSSQSLATSYAIVTKADLVWYSEGQEIVVLSEQKRQNDVRNRTEIPQDAKGTGAWTPEVSCQPLSQHIFRVCCS